VHEILFKNMDLSFINRIGYQVLLPYNTQVTWAASSGARWCTRTASPPRAGGQPAGHADAETAAVQAGAGRKAGLQAVRDYFYQGPLAAAIVKLHQQQGGLFTAADLAQYRGGWETPLQGSYGDYTFYTNGTGARARPAPWRCRFWKGST